MDIFFTVMIKENDTSNLKLLTEKLNDGFHTTENINVGKSTVVILRKRERTRYETEISNSISAVSLDSEPTPVYYSGSGLSMTELNGGI